MYTSVHDNLDQGGLHEVIPQVSLILRVFRVGHVENHNHKVVQDEDSKDDQAEVQDNIVRLFDQLEGSAEFSP